MLTNRDAWLLASSWGSYGHSGDPGSCMYGFNERFEVQDESHRRQCLRYVQGLLTDMRRSPPFWAFMPGCKAEMRRLKRKLRVAAVRDELRGW